MRKKLFTFINLSLLANSAFCATLAQNPKESSLVIYNSNVGVVHEIKALHLKKSQKEIIYPNVARSIVTNSVNLQLPSDIRLYSQQYRYDKLSIEKLLSASIGKKINYKTKHAELLSFDSKNVLLRDENKTIISAKISNISFNSIPKELLIKPSLVWNVTTNKDVDTDITLDYLIKSIRWSSDYVLSLHSNTADLTGWISINNRSGKAFKNTQLYVLAGEINRASNHHIQRDMVMYKAAMAAPVMAKEQAHEGYHIYTIPFKVHLANNEKTQIKFIEKNNIKIKRLYSARMNNPLYMHGEINSGVSQFVQIQKLNVPLPQGIVRTYSKMKQTNILLGETNIKHTPKNTNIKLRLGKNFDLKVTQRVLSRDESANYLSVDIKYIIKNKSQKAKVVTLFVPFNKNKHSKITTTQKYKFTKGNLATFTLHIPKNTQSSFSVHFESKK